MPRYTESSRSAWVRGDSGFGQCGQDNAPGAVPSPLLAKISRLVPLAPDEIAAVDALPGLGTPIRGEQLLYREGEPPVEAFLITQGLAFRCKRLAGGQRQILSYLIPGDICGIRCSAPHCPDHDVWLLDQSRAVRIDLGVIADMVARFPAIGRGLALAALADRAILREWLLNVGQRSSVQRLSHFFCEMAVRLGRVGGVDANGSFALPLSQAALADTIGLTPVHVNRTLQRLRLSGLITLRQGHLTILDRDGLAEIAGFDENYLNIGRCED